MKVTTALAELEDLQAVLWMLTTGVRSAHSDVSLAFSWLRTLTRLLLPLTQSPGPESWNWSPICKQS